MIGGPGVIGYRRSVTFPWPFDSSKVLCHEDTAGAAVHMFAKALGCSSQRKVSKCRSTGNDNAMTTPGTLTDVATAKSMRLISRAVATGRLQTISSGIAHIPVTGPALIVVRHYHHLYDGLALFAALPRQFHIVVALDWVQNPSMRLLMTQLTRLARWPVVLRADALMHKDDRGVSQFRQAFSLADVERYQLSAFRDSVQLLVENRLLVVFPEGYPNIDPAYTPKTDNHAFLPFKRGFVAIARAAERRLGISVPIVPTGLHYNVGKSWKAHVRFSPPIKRESFASGNDLIRYCEEKVKQLSS
jgi:1-acyl-sn-glycerol-3-phosphate acyltransferase